MYPATCAQLAITTVLNRRVFIVFFYLLENILNVLAGTVIIVLHKFSLFIHYNEDTLVKVDVLFYKDILVQRKAPTIQRIDCTFNVLKGKKCKCMEGDFGLIQGDLPLHTKGRSRKEHRFISVKRKGASAFL